jgi:transcriptional regulator GlxA family with amidase domain
MPRDVFRRKRPRAARSAEAIVERVEAHVEANLGAKIPLARLCAVVGLSERGLRNAFYDARGMSPRRSLLERRLHTVRLVLGRAGRSETTVTAVATGHGFYELGRFAGAYKDLFGEMPSETLRRGGKAETPVPTSATNEGRHAGTN